MTVPQAKARASLWQRIRAAFARRPVAFCSRCGNVLDNGQRLPSGTRTVCAGTVKLSTSDGKQLHTFCQRFTVGLG